MTPSQTSKWASLLSYSKQQNALNHWLKCLVTGLLLCGSEPVQVHPGGLFSFCYSDDGERRRRHACSTNGHLLVLSCLSSSENRKWPTQLAVQGPLSRGSIQTLDFNPAAFPVLLAP